jgi:hypothetical protein
MKDAIKIFFALLITPLSLFSWWDTPHMAINAIAYDHLDDKIKIEVDRLSKELGNAFPATGNFITLACFADDIPKMGFKALSSWHYSDLPYDPENILSPKEALAFVETQKNSDCLFAIKQACATLKNPNACPWAKSVMLAFLTHCVADMHQPVHAVTLFSKEFPQGDLGATLFLIDYEIKNLHALWDSGCGIGVDNLSRPLDQNGYDYVNNLARMCAQAYPQGSLKEEVNDLETFNWRQESYELAVLYVYDDLKKGAKPSEEYLKKGREICMKQIALAGYRLAFMLNEVLKQPE